MCRRPTYTPMPTLRRRALQSAGMFLMRQSKGRPRLLRLDLDRPTPKESAPALDLVVPTDLIIAAWRGLFPAERMTFLGGSKTGAQIRVSSSWDVTGANRSVVHVTASSALLARTLLDFEASGVRVAAWLHSHPGRGPTATHPSQIDWRQDADLRRDFGDCIVGFIATEDGYIRAWGHALSQGLVKLTFQGSSIEFIPGESHVYRLALR